MKPMKTKSSKTITVISDGTTGEKWITSLEKSGIVVSRYAKELLQSKDFIPTTAVVYKVAIIKGDELSDKQLITIKDIREEVENRGYLTPPVELACLLREKLSNDDLKKMGLRWLITLHKPIVDSFGGPSLLGADANVAEPWLDACYGGPARRWVRESGFACVVPQVNSTNYETLDLKSLALRVEVLEKWMKQCRG